NRNAEAAEPQHERARRHHLDGEQDAAGDEPAPEPELDDEVGHCCGSGRSVRNATPVAEPVGGPGGRRGGGGDLPSPPKVSRPISPMPAGPPGTPPPPDGTARPFWVGGAAGALETRACVS